jgi:hypothetical protein
MRKYRIFLLFFTIVVSLFLKSCCQHDTTVPYDLLGVWKTSAHNYKDRYIKFTEDLLILGIGDEREAVHYIEGIESVEQENNNILYSFNYMNIDSLEEEIFTLKFIYYPDSGGIIKLQNRDEIWKKIE